jgi:simple sugar transport system ATP-binding protein
VAGLTVADEHGLPVNELSFQVRAGEILGIAGVQGNGQTELCEALMGLRPTAAGSVTLNGHDLTRASPRARLRAGVAYVPEDRKEDGLVGSFSVAENLILDTYNRPPFASGVNLNLPAIRANATALIEEFDVRTGSPATPAGTLSGGNQQKVILAREVGREHKVLIASQPTRGLDVGSIEFVHRRIVEQRDHGVAVIIVSSELDEIYALADRIAVMYEGKITGFRDPDVPTAELGRLMAGGADGGHALALGPLPDADGSAAPSSAAPSSAAPSSAAPGGAAATPSPEAAASAGAPETTALADAPEAAAPEEDS